MQKKPQHLNTDPGIVLSISILICVSKTTFVLSLRFTASDYLLGLQAFLSLYPVIPLH